ncbi:MAG: type II secretion system protein [Christensenellales bacterium]
MKKEIKNKQAKGITLIALVVTIVVLLILAGVSLSLVLNNNGVISRAKEAKNRYAEEQTNDEKQLNELANGIDEMETGIKKVDGVPIPEGFVYVGGTKASGLVISDAAADKEKYKGQTTVGTDLQGNQFVWIPVENIADYKRTAYSTNVATGTTDTTTNSEQIKASSSSNFYYTEALPEDEKTSVEKNKGYYIGRYEAGDKESTEATPPTFRTSSSSTSNTITVKAGQASYNYIKYTDAKSLAEGFSGKQGYTSVKSKLVSSYAWDTAIAFIQKTNSDYGNSSEEGNYNNSPTFTYTGIADTEKNKQTKANGTSTLIPTGQTTAVNNIYDMGGNVWELTTESCSLMYGTYTSRGGDYYDHFADGPAGSRGGGSGNASGRGGFRLTLFL